MAREMQTMVVSKEIAKTKREAEAVYRRQTGRRPRTIRETSTSWRFAQFDEAQCVSGSYATEERAPGVAVVWCERRRPAG